jgi:uncharacterized protein (TIGR03067 family)
MMRAVLMFAVLAVAVPDRPRPVPTNENSLQEQPFGAWQVAKITLGIMDMPNIPEKPMLVFLRGEIQVHENGQRKMQDDTAYVLDETKKPAAIDIIPKRQGEKKLEGILKLEGDVLTMCMSVDGSGNRPMEFRSDPNLKAVLFQLRRVKK